ncbi:outer membrane protein [Terrihabitans rhizophilus]|uniref:Outer membrane beta-barrel protein n=1 Tax=Terrihabitans rhizophilus TaxID=3092662 RepID=A0ABU4RIL4_9HYPH|nr:outer membrane beta-barrel protein [Terrihabitans sp. PJ23]MDX6804674.1 outer membrane beta-barrel protein [Terrihabitans sp. PJ23]
MKRFLLTSMALLSVGTMAHAADMPAYEAAPAMVDLPGHSWTGFYIGAQAGYALGSNDDNDLEFDTDLDGSFDDTVLTGGGADAFAPGFTSDFDDGFSGGLRIGYDHQVSNFVFGVVVDASFVDVADRVNGLSVTPADYTFERELNYLVTGRLRGGYAFDRFMVYATGGVAYGDIDYTFSTNSPAAFAGATEGDSDAWGYTVGAGAEMMLTQNISLGVEYLYTDLDVDTQTARFTSGAFAPGTDLRPSEDEFDFHTLRATMAYRF